MKPATLDRKVREIEKEGVEQAKWWLRHGNIGPLSVDMAACVLISTYFRAATLRGDYVSVLELS